MKVGAIKQIAIKRLSEIKNVHFSLFPHYSLLIPVVAICYSPFAICCSPLTAHNLKIYNV